MGFKEVAASFTEKETKKPEIIVQSNSSTIRSLTLA